MPYKGFIWAYLPQENSINCFVELHASHQIVDQGGQPDLCACPCIADGFDVHPVHRISHESKDVLDSCAMP